MKVTTDTVVTVDYTLSVQDGETPENLRKRFTARFIYGRNPVLPALERAVIGKDQGENVEVLIPPEESFGKYDPNLVSEIHIKNICFPERLKVGEYYREMAPDGRPFEFLVKKINGNYVLADFNHPAAGKTLILNAKIMEVRPASTIEILKAMNMACTSGGG